jgi:pantothenate kinase
MRLGVAIWSDVIAPADVTPTGIGPSAMTTTPQHDRLIDLAGLAEHLRRSQGAGRRLVALAGPPGAGKSTVAEALCAEINQQTPSLARILAMDGFHFDDRVLEARGQRARKGAPDTFDTGGLVAMLDRLRADDGREIAVPVFDRALEIARAAAAIIPAATRIVIVEGNYLLLDDSRYPDWAHLSSRFDVTVMLEVPRARLAERLAARWRGFGLEAAAVTAKLEGNDLVNADLVTAGSRPADFRLRNDAAP